MANYFFIKGERGYQEKQKEELLDFLDQQGYSNIYFLYKTLPKAYDNDFSGKALIARWGNTHFDQYKKSRSIKIDGKTYFYGVLKPVEYNLDDFDAVVHVYASVDSVLAPLQNTFEADHIFDFGNSNIPDLEEWMAILDAKAIIQNEQINPITWGHLNPQIISELDRIKTVNVVDGGTHSMDEALIKEVLQKVNKQGSVLDAATFKAFLVREVHFKPQDAENTAHKFRKFL